MTGSILLHPCQTKKDMYEAVKLRYTAYRNVGAIEENPEAEFKDRYDFLPNSQTCLVYEENNPVASVRACIYDRENDFKELPALEVYRDEIAREIGLDKRIIESNRFVIDPGRMDSKQLFKIPFRFIILNALKFNCDFIITAVRPKHIPLYKRFFGLEPISGLKKYPGIQVEMVIVAADCAYQIPLAMAKDEIFRITDEEVKQYQPQPGALLTV